MIKVESNEEWERITPEVSFTYRSPVRAAAALHTYPAALLAPTVNKLRQIAAINRRAVTTLCFGLSGWVSSRVGLSVAGSIRDVKRPVPPRGCVAGGQKGRPRKEGVWPTARKGGDRLIHSSAICGTDADPRRNDGARGRCFGGGSSHAPTDVFIVGRTDKERTPQNPRNMPHKTT